jgi:hypothetical protein
LCLLQAAREGGLFLLAEESTICITELPQLRQELRLWQRPESVLNVLNLKDCGRVAQVVEQCPFKAWVAGSNPAALTNLFTTSELGYSQFCVS